MNRNINNITRSNIFFVKHLIIYRVQFWGEFRTLECACAVPHSAIRLADSGIKVWRYTVPSQAMDLDRELALLVSYLLGVYFIAMTTVGHTNQQCLKLHSQTCCKYFTHAYFMKIKKSLELCNTNIILRMQALRGQVHLFRQKKSIFTIFLFFYWLFILLCVLWHSNNIYLENQQ